MEAWLKTPQAKRQRDEAERKAWAHFKSRYSNADLSQFHVQIVTEGANDVTGFVQFREGPGYWSDVFKSDPKYWSEKKRKALGVGGFPFQLTANNEIKRPIPAVNFSDNPESFGSSLNSELKIFVTPSQYFMVKFRNIFKETVISHESGKESRRWLSGPDMRYWPQQLNFAFWCATTGCGIARDTLDIVPEKIKSFLLFHIYFTVRRILWEMAGIQSVSALPGDPTFSQANNHYDIPSYKRICAEFGIGPSTDFRFKKGANHGLGKVFIYATGLGLTPTHYEYPGWNKFSDEGEKATDGDLINLIRNDLAENQFDYFMISKSEGLSQAGMARLNQSIEAYVYCILGAQVNVRSSILGSGGSAKETQREFLTLMEDSIRQPDISKSVQRFQLAIDEAKVRLDLAVSPGTWLMPSDLEINTMSAVGCNNNLKKADADMKLGVNSVNSDMKRLGVRPMDGGGSRIKRPTSHPSNPIHRQSGNIEMRSSNESVKQNSRNSDESHEMLKTGVFIAAAVSAFLIYRFR